MNKIINLIEKASIKAQPGKYNKLKESCVKLQAVLDRNKLHKRMEKVPIYKDELSFYGMIIPGLINKVSKKAHPELPEKTKLYFLHLEVEEWIQKNLQQCSTFIKHFDKTKLPLRKITPRKRSSSVRSSIRDKSTIKRSSTKKRSSIKRISRRRSSLEF